MRDKHVRLSKAREMLTQIVNDVTFHEQRIVFTRNNKNVAVLVPMEDLAKIRAWEDMEDIKAAKKVKKQIKKTRGKQLIDWNEMEKRVDWDEL